MYDGKDVVAPENAESGGTKEAIGKVYPILSSIVDFPSTFSMNLKNLARSAF